VLQDELVVGVNETFDELEEGLMDVEDTELFEVELDGQAFGNQGQIPSAQHADGHCSLLHSLVWQYPMQSATY
jgi:hypothetical protein